MKIKIKTMKFLSIMALISTIISCAQSNDFVNNPSNPVVNEVDFWLTKGDQSIKLQKQVTELVFKNITNAYQNIEVDETQSFQTIDGFGYTLTGGSAEVING